jgi:hypothetical protein
MRPIGTRAVQSRKMIIYAPMLFYLKRLVMGDVITKIRQCF